MKMKITGDLIGKILVIVLVALFLGLTLAEKKSSSSAATGFPGGMPTGGFSGGGAPSGAAGSTGGAAAGTTASGAMAGNRTRNTGSTSTAKTVTVNCKTVEPETLLKTVRVSGDIASKTQVTAYPITTGKVTSILKKIGDTVTKGEVIGWIDPSKPGSTYAASAVTAPVSGTIISMSASVGDNASAQQAFAVVGSVKDLTLTVYVSEKYSANMKAGLPAFISVTSAPGESFNARVSAVSPVVNKTNRTVEVTLELTEYDSRIKPGMYASVQLAVNQATDALVVPNKALHTWNDKTVLYVIDSENTARRVIVETGLSTDFETQITSGLSAGDRVITAGSVADGTPVRIAAGN